MLSIGDFGGRHYDPGDGNNLGIGVGYADLTAPVGRYCVGAFYRSDYAGQASRDALDAMVANRSGQSFDVGRHYSLAVDSTWLESAGVKVTRVFGFEPAARWSLRFGVTASLMKALSLSNEQLHGTATATSGDYAVGSASLTRTLSDYEARDFNPFVGRADPDGLGIATDLGAVLQSPSGYVVELTVMDAYSYVDWQDVPQSRDKVDNATIRFDANFNREAFIQGEDRRVNVAQPLQPRFRAMLAAPLRHGLTVVISDDYASGTHFPALGVRLQHRDIDTQLSFDAQTRAVSLSWQWAWFSLAVTTNDIDPGRATVLGAGLRFASRW
ncbi:MAG: hypothetical protein NDI84_00445 [Steroidobacteraceae bacterium]|nr:hypothetical protein [Steroidobacteraceae bacterium]